MIKIADPLYNIVTFPEYFKSLIDNPYLQRLRRIRQLGTAYLVYPSANHTRFEHSLGVAYLAGMIAENLELDKSLYIAAGLLHDIGHGPFSHLSEEVLKNFTGVKHEDLSIKKIKCLKDLLSDIGVRYREIIKEISGRGVGIVAGDLDADRLDYLQRDAYFTGNFSGINNIFYLIYNFIVDKNKNTIALKEKAIPITESILASRLIMYRTVYLHKTVIASSLLLQESIKNLLDEFSPEEIYSMDDCQLISILRSKNDTYHKKLENRDLPKLVFTIKLDTIQNYDFKKYNELLEDLRTALNSNFVYLWPMSNKKRKWHTNIKVLIDGESKKLVELSSLLRNILKAERDMYQLRVYVDRSLVKSDNIKVIQSIINKLYKK
ncbi:MAG TPA: HD domain-containing protein [Candidatus Nanopusillus sp.]|nr:HD domain-containing protein [Candidatus Nanopusillus sp.]